MRQPGVGLLARRRTAAVMVCGAFSLAGLTTCAVAVTGLVHDRPAVRDFGVTSAPDAHPRDTSPTTVPSRGRSSRPPAADPQFVPGPPTRLQIPVLKVDATVDSVATVDGQLTVPDDPMTVGWWAGAANLDHARAPLSLTGTSTQPTAGLGAFFHLTALRAGDIVTLTTTGGDQVTYRVTARRFYPKDGAAAEPIRNQRATPARPDHVRWPVRRPHPELSGQHRRLCCTDEYSTDLRER